MRALVQRVSRARVQVESEVVGEIGNGLCCLVGVTHDDSRESASKLARKLTNMRIFGDEHANMNLSVTDVNGEILVISQFTLYGDTRKGRRPSFVEAAPPARASALIEDFVAELELLGVSVATGIFGAMMNVDLTNVGPVTLMVEV